MSDAPSTNPWYHDFDEVYRRFYQGLVSAVKARLDRRLRRRVQPEDVAHSTLMKFHRGCRDGTYRFDNSRAVRAFLWKVMGRKLDKMERFHLSKKRDFTRDESFANSSQRPVAAARQPCPMTRVEEAESLRRLGQGFSERDLAIVRLCLQGYTTPEIAGQMGCSRWTARRVLDAFGDRVRLGTPS